MSEEQTSCSLRLVAAVLNLIHNLRFFFCHCGRMEDRQGAILLIGRRRCRCFPWRCPHGRKSAGQSAGRVWKRRGKRRWETRRKTEWGHKQQTINRSPWMAWRWYVCALADTSANAVWCTSITRCELHEKNDVRGVSASCVAGICTELPCSSPRSFTSTSTCQESCWYLSAPPVGYNGSLSTVNETNCNKKEIPTIFFLSSLPIPFRLVPPRRAWRWMPSSLLAWMETLFSLFSWSVV